MRPVLLCVLLFGVAVHSTTVTIADLNCVLNISANGINLPDESSTHEPTVLVTKQDTALVFELHDDSLAAQVFVKIVTSSATFTGYDSKGNAVGNVVTLIEAEAEDAVTVKPGAFPTCAGTTGCDGLHLDTIALQTLFPSNASYVLFTCILEYSSNGSVTLLSPFHVLGIRKPQAVIQAADTVIGTSPPVTTNISLAGTITPTGGSTASSFWTTAAIAGVAVGCSLGLILLIAIGCWCWSHDKLGGDRQQSKVYGEAATEMQGPYGTYGPYGHQPVPAQHTMLGHHRRPVTGRGV